MPLISTTRGPLWVSGRQTGNLPLLLIHGAGGTRLQWPKSLRQLPGVDSLALDLPGHGNSPPQSRDTIDAYTADVIALLDARALPQALIAGHSMGGAVALQLALDAPDKCAGLVLIGTGAKLTVNPALLEQARDDPPAAAYIVANWVWNDDTPEAIRQQHYESLMALPPGTLYSDLLACNRFDIRERLSQISAPTLVITGARDRMTPPKYGEYLRQRLRDAELIALDASHMMMLEQPEAVGNAVQTWLQNRLNRLTL